MSKDPEKLVQWVLFPLWWWRHVQNFKWIPSVKAEKSVRTEERTSRLQYRPLSKEWGHTYGILRNFLMKFLNFIAQNCLHLHTCTLNFHETLKDAAALFSILFYKQLTINRTVNPSQHATTCIHMNILTRNDAFKLPIFKYTNQTQIGVLRLAVKNDALFRHIPL